MICLHQGLLINYCIIFYFSLLCFLFFIFVPVAIVVFFELSCLFYPSCSKKKIITNVFVQCDAVQKHFSLSKHTNTHQIDLSFDRILQYVYTNTSIHIHIQINSNQSNQTKSIMSYPVITLAMPFFLQDCYKNRVSFWCSLTTILCIFFFQNNFNQNSKQLKLNLFAKHFKFTLIGIKLLLMSKFH